MAAGGEWILLWVGCFLVWSGSETTAFAPLTHNNRGSKFAVPTPPRTTTVAIVQQQQDRRSWNSLDHHHHHRKNQLTTRLWADGSGNDSNFLAIAVGGFVTAVGTVIALGQSGLLDAKKNDKNIADNDDNNNNKSRIGLLGSNPDLARTVELEKKSGSNGLEARIQQMWMTRDRVGTVPQPTPPTAVSSSSLKTSNNNNNNYMQGLGAAASLTNTFSPYRAQKQSDPSTTGRLKSSYAMSNWSPYTPVPNAGMGSGSSSSSYLASMNGGNAGTNIARVASPSNYANNNQDEASYNNLSSNSNEGDGGWKPVYSSDKAHPRSGGQRKQSYGLNTWSPDDYNNNKAFVSPGGITYLASMSAAPISPVESMPPAPAPSPPSMAPFTEAVAAWSPPPQSSVLSQPSSSWTPPPSPLPSTVTTTTAKKSYSMTSWSPNKPTKEPSVGSGNSYLSKIGGTNSTLATAWTAPPPAPASYPTSTTSSTAAIADTWSSNQDASLAKKSYSMTSWSPNKPATESTGGYGGSYLTNIAKSAEPTSTYSTTPPATTPEYYPASTTTTSNAAWSSSQGAIPAKKSYSMTSWSPNKPATVQSGGSSSYLSNIAAGASASSTSTYSASATAWTPPPPPVQHAPTPAFNPATSSTTSSWSMSQDVNPAKMSYAMTSWSPNKPATEQSGGSSSYLSNIAAGVSASSTSTYSASTTAWTPPPPPAQPAPTPAFYPATSSTKSSWSTSQDVNPAKMSYAMTSWSPNKPATEQSGGSTSYLSNIAAGASASSTSTYSASATAWTPPPPPPQPSSWSMSQDVSPAKRSYSMTSWSPNKPATEQSGGSTSYLSNIAAGVSSSSTSTYSASANAWTPPQPPAQPAPTPAFYPATSSTTSSWSTSQDVSPAKKSYSMTSWSPNKPATEQSGGSSSYLSNIAAGVSASSTSTYSASATAWTPPPPPVQHAPTPAFNPATSSTTSSWSMSQDVNPAKMSYAMTSWSPNKPATEQSGGSSSYLSNIAAGVSASSTSTYSASATAWTPPPPPAQPAPTPAFYPATSSTTSSWSTSQDVSPAKKSYSMTSWSPNTPATEQSGGSSSYLSNIAAGASASSTSTYSASATAWTPPPPPAQPAPTPAFYPATWSTSSSGSTSQASQAKKSYSMTSWSPNKPVTEQSGGGNSYLSATSGSDMGVSQPAAYVSPLSAPARPPPPLDNVSSYKSWSVVGAAPGHQNSELPRKSFSMTSWSPKSPTNTPSGTSGSSSSHLTSMSNGAVSPSTSSTYSSDTPATPSLMSPVAQPRTAYTPAQYSTPSPSTLQDSNAIGYLSSLAGTSGSTTYKAVKKSYSMSDWAPGDRVNNAVTNPYLTNMNYAPRPVTSFAASSQNRVSSNTGRALPSATEGYVTSSVSGLGLTGTTSEQPSYSMSNWSPNQGTIGNSGVNSPAFSTTPCTINGINGDNSYTSSVAQNGAFDSGSRSNNYSFGLPSPSQWSSARNGSDGKGDSSSLHERQQQQQQSVFVASTAQRPPPQVKKSSYGPTKWSPEKGVPSRVI